LVISLAAHHRDRQGWIAKTLFDDSTPEHKRSGSVIYVDSESFLLLLDYPLNSAPDEMEMELAKRLSVDPHELLVVSTKNVSLLLLKITERPKIFDDNGSNSVYCWVCSGINSRNNCYLMCRKHKHFSCCKHRFPWDPQMHRPPWERLQQRGKEFLALAEEKDQLDAFTEIRFLMVYNGLEDAVGPEEVNRISSDALIEQKYACDVCQSTDKSFIEDDKECYTSVSDLKHSFGQYSVDKLTLEAYLKNPPASAPPAPMLQGASGAEGAAPPTVLAPQVDKLHLLSPHTLHEMIHRRGCTEEEVRAAVNRMNDQYDLLIYIFKIWRLYLQYI